MFDLRGVRKSEFRLDVKLAGRTKKVFKMRGARKTEVFG